MSETTEKLVGIKQVLLPEFKAAEEAGTTKGYMWVVRDNNITLHNYIYLGSRLYGEAEIEVPFDSVITNILSDNSIVVTKTSLEEGTTVELKVNLDPDGGLVLTENGLQIDMSQFVSQSELDKVKEDLATVNTNLVTSINAINQNVADGFNTINGGIENEIKPAIEEAKKMATDETERALAAEAELLSKISDNSNVDTLKEEVESVKSEIVIVKEDLATVNTNLVTSINNINQNMMDGFNTINGGINDEIRPELEKAVKYKDFATDRKTIELSNHDTVSGLMTNGTGVNIAMVSKWDIADFGSTQLPINLNGSKERPTYNDTKDIALLEDVASASDGVEDLSNVINDEIKPEIESLKNDKVSWLEVDKQGQLYKVIKLDNHANLIGEGADELSGRTYNIAMVSKWNKVDLGSASLEINLNGKANRPTYNDAKEIALIEDVNGKISSVELVQDADNQLHYELMVDGVVKGDINIPKDQFLKNVEYDDTTKELVFTFDTTDGENVTKVNIGELVDTYEAGNGLELNGNIFSIKLDPSSQSYVQITSDGIKIIAIDEAISDIDEKITAEETRASGVEAKLRTDVDYEHERALEAEANINRALETKVTWDESKSKIVLPSGGQVVGTKYGTDGSNPADGATIAQLSQYDIMDFGSSKYPLNLNVPAGVRVTVQEQGQSGEDANKVAYLSDVATKVDKIEGKGLSEEDFTTALKTKLEGLNDYDDTALEERITDNEQAIADKVDKVDGMGLSQENFTTVLKTKLEGLNDYDDTDIKNSITSLDTAYKAADTELDDKIAAIRISVEKNETNIADVRSGLTAETTLQATNYNNLNTRLNSEVTTARDRENDIERKIDNILNNGLTLSNNKSISARPIGSTDSPVNILTLNSNNVIEVGSNIGNLSLKSKGSPVISINDGVAKEIALKEQVDELQRLINELTSRIETLENKP